MPDKIDVAKIESQYGLSYALFKAFPELNHLLNRAIGGGWAPDKFQVELRQTQWFRKHSDAWRQATALRYSDPTTYRERVRNSVASTFNLARQFSVGLTNAQLRNLGERAFVLGMSEDEIKDVLANHVKPDKAGHYIGQLSGLEQQVRATAQANGYRLGRRQLQDWMKAIVRGDADMKQLETHIRDVTAQSFAAYGDQIRGGMNLADVATPFIQSMSSILELDSGSLDMFDPTLRRAMQGTYDKNRKEQVAMSIGDFEDTLRRDKRWQYTQNAQEQARGYVASISRLWGLS